MPIFGRKSQKGTLFLLPEISPENCIPLVMPNIQRGDLIDIVSLQRLLREGQNMPDWIIRISDSEKFWDANSVDISSTVIPIVHIACARQNAEPDDVWGGVLLMLAKFGMLAGYYERKAGVTPPELCHPLIWNCVAGFRRTMPEEFVETSFYQTNTNLFSVMSYLGYVFGKVPDMNSEVLFSEWN